MSEPVTIHIAPGVKLLKNVMIPMRDGVHLAADLYMPDGPESTRGWDKFSVLMDYIPYRKDEVNAAVSRHYLYLPRHGHVVARVDIRGTGGSEGVSVDEYTLQEQQDGYDAVEWLAAQPWCNGRVHMMGISYGGFTSVQVAAHAPPHLTSIIPVDFTDDRYTDDCHYRGGLVRKYYDIGFYGNAMNIRNALPPHPDWSGEGFSRVWEQHLEHNEPYILKWFNHQTDGPYWRNGSVREIADRIRCAVFMIGGWRDGYPNPPLRLYQSLTTPKKVWIGPWDHNYPDTAIPGPRVDHLREVVRWLDYWGQGVDNGVMDEPPVVIYMQHYQEPVVDRLDTIGEWRAETGWPIPGAAEKALYLGEGGTLANAPSGAGSDEYDYQPTVGLTAGLWSGGARFGLPGDQRPDEAFSLNYTTPPLEADVHILGWPRAVLHVASTAPVMGFCASLSDVAPDGTSHLVAKGMLNGTRRKSFADPEAMTPGEIYELDIQIDCTAWRFEQGHRIRLSVASADWPNVWPTPYLGRNTLYRSQDRPSRLVLPAVPAQGSAAPPHFQPADTTIRRFSDAIEPPTWQVIHDVLTGRVTSNIRTVTDYRVDDTTVVRRESSVVSQVDPRDPAHATAHGQSIQHIRRPNQILWGRSDLMVQATATHFHISLDVEIKINGAPHYTRRWVESVARQLL